VGSTTWRAEAALPYCGTLPGVDAAVALAELRDLSTQIEAIVVLRRDGSVVAATLAGDAAAGLAAAGAELVEEARRAAAERGGEALAGVHAATPSGSVFAAVDGDRTLLATTGPDPTAGLVLYDLKMLLRRLEREAAVAQG
jgi:predicted regulator of Ras-like GTPase activity (Roadblock/LC7/MglB family)